MKKPGYYLLKYCTICVFFTISILSKAQSTFQGIRLSNGGTQKNNDYENLNEIQFSFNTNQIIEYLRKSKEGAPLIIELDGMKFFINVKIDPASAFLNTNLHPLKLEDFTGFVLTGTLYDDPNSKVWLSIAKDKFICGTIISMGKIYQFRPVFGNQGFLPNICNLEVSPSKCNKFSTNDLNNPENVLCDVYVDLGLQIDQSFVDEFNGDVQAAKMWALSAASSMDLIWGGIQAPNGSNSLNFYFLTKTVWFPEPYSVDNLFNQAFENWADNIIGDWSSNRPCIRKDGIIYITGRQGSLGSQQGTASGRTKNNQGYLCESPPTQTGGRVSIVIATKINGALDQSETAETMAHELGHQFGICGHENEPPPCGCSDDCNDGLLMCSSSNGVFMSSCMQGKLNQLLGDGNNIFRCPCLTTELPVITTEDCEICYAKPTSILADNLNPIKGCGQGRDIINIVATIKGGCNPAENVPIRVEYDPRSYKPLKDSDGKIVSTYFNKEFPGQNINSKELRKVADPAQNNSPEINVAHIIPGGKWFAKSEHSLTL